MEVDAGGLAHEELGHDEADARAHGDAVAAHAGGDVEALHTGGLAEDGCGVGAGVYAACPGALDLQPTHRWQEPAEVSDGTVYEVGVGLGLDADGVGEGVGSFGTESRGGCA